MEKYWLCVKLLWHQTSYNKTEWVLWKKLNQTLIWRENTTRIPVETTTKKGTFSEATKYNNVFYISKYETYL